MFQLVKQVNGNVLWRNIHLLFWLSLVPFATGWMGENHFSLWPVVVYGIVLLMCAIAYTLLVFSIIKVHEKKSLFAKAIGKDVKGKVSMALYIMGLILAFVHSWLAITMYIIVAAIWFIPDRRIEKNYWMIMRLML